MKKFLIPIEISARYLLLIDAEDLTDAAEKAEDLTVDEVMYGEYVEGSEEITNIKYDDIVEN